MTLTMAPSPTDHRTGGDPVRGPETCAERVAVASHDLRNSLSVVLGHLDLLRHPTARHPLPDALDAIERCSRRMLDTISAVLEGEPPTPAAGPPLRLIPICREVAAEVKVTHPGRLALVRQSADAFVAADRCSVERILANLVRNAVIHTTPETVVDLLVAPGPDRSWVSIFVRDDGPGISANRRATIFEPYERGDTTAEGSGLGLAISRELARALGGDLLLLDRDGPGCCFELRLPRAPRHG